MPAVALRLARGKRNGTQEKIHNVLRQYHSRSRIPTKLLPSSAIFKTLPRLSSFLVRTAEGNQRSSAEVTTTGPAT